MLAATSPASPTWSTPADSCNSNKRALAIKADVRDQRQLDEAVSRGITEFGKIDVLIANAGIWTQAPF